MLSPHIFREYDIRGIVGADLNEQTVATIGDAVAAYFVRHKAQKIVVGYDARESSPAFQEIFVSKLKKAGCDVLDIGRVPTPVLYFALFTASVDGGVMITGSHNPPDHNGFKISLGQNSLYGKQIQEIKKLVLAGAMIHAPTAIFSRDEEFNKNPRVPEVRHINFLNAYLNDLHARVSMGTRRLKIVVDAGNGMGGVTAVPLYEKLGAEITELYCEPDSKFPNHEPDPSQEKNLTDLIEKVLETNADFGIAFDGDGDRLTIVDDCGEIIWGDKLLMLFAREVLKDNPGATVVAEVKCTQILFDEIERAGGRAVMSKAGHSIIKGEMKKTSAILAGEMSGHIFFADRFYGFDDAAYAGARLLEILSKTNGKLSEIFAHFPQTYATPEIRIPCPEEKKEIVIEKLVAHFSKNHEINTTDGARIKFPDAWGLVRPSNTQALLILRCEADTKENLEKICQIIEIAVKDFIK